MDHYVAESYNSTLEQAGRDSEGVVGTGGGSEKIYLHLITISDTELRQLTTRVDEHGNKQHDRIAIANREDWWIAVEGEKVWPGTRSPKVVSKCVNDPSVAPKPARLSEAELVELKRVNAKIPR